MVQIHLEPPTYTGNDMADELENYTVIDEDDEDPEDLKNPIFEDGPVVDQIREILSLGYSPEDIYVAAEWIDINTEWEYE
jgi:hypothetical protein